MGHLDLLSFPTRRSSDLMVGVCAALFFSGLGFSSVSSVVAPYAVSRPGESPFQQPQRTGSAGAMSQALVMLGAIARSEEHTSELQSRRDLVCRLLLEKKK